MKIYLTISGILFALVALLHALRILKNWPAVIGEWTVPLWVSGVVVVVAGYLAYSAWKLMKS